MHTLVIVESPAKAKTLGRFLGRDYTVRASLGHVRDLPVRELGVDVEHGFKPTYHQLAKKHKAIALLRAALAEADRVILATDPDREGEAIAWHLVKVLRPGVPVQRVAFHEITEPAIREAFAHPRALNMPLVDAQQARRVLDRLVGYQISPLLWRTLGGKSAGRVQSVAVRLVVDREREIRDFVPEEYWTVHADLAKQADHARHFLARLVKIGTKAPELKSKADADAVLTALQGARYAVGKIKRERKERRPWPPFTTSTLQQGASARLHMAPAETMRHAQHLYEGVTLGEGKAVGLITYMRTDSTAVSPEAQAAAREFITQRFGAEYVPAQPPVYASRVKNAQEAHEAIRPTDVRRTPESVRPYLDAREWELYDLIWRRFIASQMKPAVYDVTTVDVVATPRPGTPLYTFRAVGRSLLFDGFLKVLDEPEEKAGEDEDEPQQLPGLAEGEPLDLLKLLPKQHFTKPPPRYTEAALIKALEERGIGRPSTYAQIMATIKDREYVALEQRRLLPTALGEAVCDALVAAFPTVMDYAFTAQIEDRLDDISRGEREWTQVLAEWYGPFAQALAGAKDIIKSRPRPPRPEPAEDGDDVARPSRKRGTRVPAEATGGVCPECGKPLVKRKGKFGDFVGCSGYPECRYVQRGDWRSPGEQAPGVAESAPRKRRTTRKTSGQPDDSGAAPKRARARKAAQTQPEELMQEDGVASTSSKPPADAGLGTCPECGRPLVQKTGKYGPFVGCSGYPECRYIRRGDPHNSARAGRRSPGEPGAGSVERGGGESPAGGSTGRRRASAPPPAAATPRMPTALRLPEPPPEPPDLPEPPGGFEFFGADEPNESLEFFDAFAESDLFGMPSLPEPPEEPPDELPPPAAGRRARSREQSLPRAERGGTGSREQPPLPREREPGAGSGEPPSLPREREPRTGSGEPPSLPRERSTRAGEGRVGAEGADLGTCPECGRPLAQKTGRYGPFIGCTGYPECRYIQRDTGGGERGAGRREPGPLPRERSVQAGEGGERAEGTDLGTCPECGRPLVQKTGKYGPFVGCSGYPECRYIQRSGSASPRR